MRIGRRRMMCTVCTNHSTTQPSQNISNEHQRKSTQHAEYFAKLPKLTASELVEFDNGCQQIQAVVFRAMEECLASAKNSVHSSFEFRLFNIQTDGILNGICQVNFPSSL